MSTKIGVVGMGYVGLTLTAALADKGFTVYGADVSPTVVASLSRGRPHIFEPGIEDIFAAHIGRTIQVDAELPRDTVDVAVISVSTPAAPGGRRRVSTRSAPRGRRRADIGPAPRGYHRADRESSADEGGSS